MDTLPKTRNRFMLNGLLVIINAMPQWKAECHVNSRVGTIPVTISAASPSGARELIQRQYGTTRIYNLREVNSNGDSVSDGTSGLGVLAVILFAFWMFFNFAPWILMFVGGAMGTWVSQFCVGSTLEEATQKDDLPRISIILILAILAGGFGFYKGTEIQNHYNSQQSQPKVQQKTWTK